MNTWKLVDKIKSGAVSYEIGDALLLIRRKSSGYPNSIKDDEQWFLKKVDRDFLIIHKHSLDGIGWLQEKRIHKTYFLPKNYLRNLKLEEILSSD